VISLNGWTAAFPAGWSASTTSTGSQVVLGSLPSGDVAAFAATKSPNPPPGPNLTDDLIKQDVAGIAAGATVTGQSTVDYHGTKALIVDTSQSNLYVRGIFWIEQGGHWEASIAASSLDPNTVGQAQGAITGIMGSLKVTG
jgi:hypothetical protein